MLYAILCHDREAEVGAWTQAEDDAAIAKLGAVLEELTREGRLGPVARLGLTGTAKRVRKSREAPILDGPFAETKEVLLGFYVVECATPEAALETARKLARACSSSGSFEVRPLRAFLPGNLPRTPG